MLKALQKIRDEISFDYTYDDDQFGGEYWQTMQEIMADIEEDGELDDDCDGAAVFFKHRCREEGHPARLVYCKTENERGHLVCEVNGYILDNRYRWVMNRDQLPYKWISISGFEDGDDWERIK